MRREKGECPRIHSREDRDPTVFGSSKEIPGSLEENQNCIHLRSWRWRLEREREEMRMWESPDNAKATRLGEEATISPTDRDSEIASASVCVCVCVGEKREG